MTEPTNIDDVKALGRRLSNWGRWGEDDEIGTLNFVTPEVRIAAAGMVRTGKVFDLGMEFGSSGPFSRAGMARFNPIHLMSVSPLDVIANDVIAADDVIVMGIQSATQWDGLAHAGYDGRLYNDAPAAVLTTRRGATRNSYTAAVERCVSRGVLLDIARLRGVDALEPGDEITADDLDAAVDVANVAVGSGDVLLIRTGIYRHFLAGDHERYMGPAPGLGLSTLQWLRAREIAAVASDNWGVELQPSRIDGWSVPFHMVAIRDMGLMLGEMFALEDLAADCAEDGVHEFLFCGTGLKITNSVGAPVTP
ncbi:MAG: cyclase family protein, partial [Actinomycetota bacterium]|nr:cyclase family protein [Actinomycetota bacterium]